MIQYLNELPESHIDRNTPLSGASYRVFHWHGEDLTIPISERDEKWKWKQWGKWSKVNPRMKIASKTYNQLGESWTKIHQWKFQN